MRIFHQAGHQTRWNIDSFLRDNCGDGLILSPVHLSKDNLEKESKNLRNASMFDPQFYIPDSPKSKLRSYDFFPATITDGFSTIDFEGMAHQSAAMCLDFQINSGFQSVIIPARYFPDLISDYIDRQKAFTVEPFLAELDRRKYVGSVFLSLPVTVAMIQDAQYRRRLLNWITSYPQIDGIYLLNELAEPTKQISNYHKLQAHVDFIKDAQEADLKVIIGYCNTEALVLTLLDPYAVTIGAYENTRGFTIDKFIEDESERRGPAPRLYFPKLLNWIRFATADEIRQDHPDLWKRVYVPTSYSETLFRNGASTAHFTKPELYKHHFILINGQLRSLASQDAVTRRASVVRDIAAARSLYDEIEESGIVYFDRNCSGDHLPAWNRIVSRL